MKYGFFLFILVSGLCFAGPVDLVFDIDQTIVTLIHDGPGGDLLADPLDPEKNTVQISYEKTIKDAEGRVSYRAVTEKYRIYEGLTELMQNLSSRQKNGDLRISFFSGGENVRNQALLKAIKLKDGRSLYDLSPSRVYGAQDLADGNLDGQRYRERFKKDLTLVNKDLENVILVDDIIDFVPETQRRNVLWLGEDFPYPERLRGTALIFPSTEMVQREKNKAYWIGHQVDLVLSRTQELQSAVSALQEVTHGGTQTPMSGLKKTRCTPESFKQALKTLRESL